MSAASTCIQRGGLPWRGPLGEANTAQMRATTAVQPVHHIKHLAAFEFHLIQVQIFGNKVSLTPCCAVRMSHNFWKTCARDLFLNTVALSDKKEGKKRNVQQFFSRITGNRGGTLETFASEAQTWAAAGLLVKELELILRLLAALQLFGSTAVIADKSRFHLQDSQQWSIHPEAAVAETKNSCRFR